MSDLHVNDMTLWQRRRVLLLMFFCNMILIGDKGIFHGTLADICAQFNIDQTTAGFLSTAYTVGHAFSTLLFGYLYTKIKSMYLLGVGLIFWSGTVWFCGLSPTFAMLFLGRVLVGLAEGCSIVVCPPVVNKIAPKESKSKWMGMYYSSSSIGVSIGSAVSGAWLSGTGLAPLGIDIANWRSLFILAGCAIVPFSFIVLGLYGGYDFRMLAGEPTGPRRRFGTNTNNNSNNASTRSRRTSSETIQPPPYPEEDPENAVKGDAQRAVHYAPPTSVPTDEEEDALLDPAEQPLVGASEESGRPSRRASSRRRTSRSRGTRREGPYRPPTISEGLKHLLSPLFIMIIISSLLGIMVVGAYNVYMIMYLHVGLGYDKDVASFIMGMITLFTGIFATWFGGFMVDFLRARHVAATNMESTSLALLMVLIFTIVGAPLYSLSFGWIDIDLFFIFFSTGVFCMIATPPPTISAILWCTERKSGALGVSVYLACTNLALSVSPPVLGYLIDKFNEEGNTAQNWRNAMLLFSFTNALTLVGRFVAWRISVHIARKEQNALVAPILKEAVYDHVDVGKTLDA